MGLGRGGEFGDVLGYVELLDWRHLVSLSRIRYADLAERKLNMMVKIPPRLRGLGQTRVTGEMNAGQRKIYGM